MWRLWGALVFLNKFTMVNLDFVIKKFKATFQGLKLLKMAF